ncbi:Proteasome subunit beta type-6 [Glycine soja]
MCIHFNKLGLWNFLETGLIVGGWDKYEGGQIYGVPLGGTIVQQPFAIGGFGSSYLYGFFDQAWKEGMTKDEAEAWDTAAQKLDNSGDEGARLGQKKMREVARFARKSRERENARASW